MRFALIADVHYPSRAPRAATFVKAIISDPSVEFVVNAGDLTDNGYAENTTCASCFGLRTRHIDNELVDYITHFDTPLRTVGKPVFSVPGNTDKYNGCLPVDSFIRERHGGTHYMLVREGVVFVYCDVYPNAAVLAWFQRKLRADPTLREKPFIFIFHYNLEDSSFGANTLDDWTTQEKCAFRNAIENLNVLGIFTGHLHQTYTYKWNKYNVYCTGGENWAIVDLLTASSEQSEQSEQSVTLQVTFTDKAIDPIMLNNKNNTSYV